MEYFINFDVILLVIKVNDSYPLMNDKTFFLILVTQLAPENKNKQVDNQLTVPC